MGVMEIVGSTGRRGGQTGRVLEEVRLDGKFVPLGSAVDRLATISTSDILGFFGSGLGPENSQSGKV